MRVRTGLPGADPDAGRGAEPSADLGAGHGAEPGAATGGPPSAVGPKAPELGERCLLAPESVREERPAAEHGRPGPQPAPQLDRLT